MEKGILLIDFGSTFTKVTAVDLENPGVFYTAKGPTTVDEDINIGLEIALENLARQIGHLPYFEEKLACSSAAGGLKMIAIGLVPELTLEAAKMAALGAGAKLQKVYSYTLTKREIAELISLKPDIVLLAGGTDGGNKEVILHNGELLAQSELTCPIVIAGNKNTQDELEELFINCNKEHYVTDNVLPTLNKLNVDPAREKIRDVFLKNIIEAKGLKKAEDTIDGIIMPTPQAVLKAGEFIAKNKIIDNCERILIVDIGGATTDVHSFSKGEPQNNGVVFRGLPQPFAKRTVEGDLGMRYSLNPLIEALDSESLLKHETQEVEKMVGEILSDIWSTSSIRDDFEEDLAKGAVDLAVKRHSGYLEITYTPHGINYLQYGKDLTDIQLVIGTGGPIVNSKNPGGILSGSLFKESDNLTLRPKIPKFSVDKGYILSAIGLMVEKYPMLAKRLVEVNFSIIKGGN
ncbi:glutamate mutase L [Alkalicella caledoniensis]|uniref:Glutamate mutase L n=1 Tax=Alkalicella caledoniensis TaxID=2731377 RepID=A0A7G9W4S1_ALKCA|nr:methylaspartate mutase accessory protein GlmL [Alkalicella caledoniensis]QNO13683.1 glutamate mutase L [Alkalicella caledoniensis]